MRDNICQKNELNRSENGNVLYSEIYVHNHNVWSANPRNYTAKNDIQPTYKQQ